MIKQDIPLYKLDLTATSEFNHVRLQAGSRREVKQSQIVIPPGAPFYQKSMKITTPDGRPLVLGEDYEFYGIMNKLTAFTAKPVGLFVRFLKDEIKEWVWDYQVVGNFNKLTNEILNMLHSIYEDDRFVLWENIMNKPLWFDPEVHQHDLTYDIYGFTDLARELNRIAHIQGTQKSAAVGFLEAFRDHIDFYCNSYRELLQGITNNHASHAYDQHAVRKQHIDLGLVDNNFTATLEEALEGLRDDLFITPYVAAQVVTAAAGRNDKLYPSGKLPLLRYGSDTFIPPTIDGSFEGLGGLTRSVGAVVEPDGTLLILQHRNNGKVRGLYFTRCADWRSQSANYEFTAYRYTHPTADAAGVVLDSIINGSNRYVMIVGDSIKNKWYWCETNGTFNPDRHILIPLTGPWIDEDLLGPAPAYWNQPHATARLVADGNYRKHFAIIQPFTLQQYRLRDPGYEPLIESTSTLNNLCYTVNIVANNSNRAVRAKMTFKTPNFGQQTGDYWFPWRPKVKDDPALPGKKLIESCFATFEPPATAMWMYRTVHAYWLKTDQADEYAVNLQQMASVRGSDGVDTGGAYIVHRSKFKISQTADGFAVNVTNTPECDKHYWLNPSKVRPEFGQYEEWYLNCVIGIIPNGADSIGSAMITPGVISYSDGDRNVSFPAHYSIYNSNFGITWDAMLRPPPVQPEGKMHYNSYDKLVVETNPIGLGTLFNTQHVGIGDIDNYNMGGVLARQNVGDGYSWIFRPINNLNTNYAQVAPPYVSQFTNTAFKHYSFRPEAYKLNIGSQVLICSPNTIDGIDNKTVYKNIMGAAADTRIDGYNGTYGLNNPSADYLWMKEVNIKLQDGQVNYNPTVVVNLESAILNDLAAIFQPHGISKEEVRKSWVIGRALGADGVMHEIAQVFHVKNLIVQNLTAFVNITPTGTPDMSKGYPVYPSATITARSNVVELPTAHQWVISNTDYGYLNYNTGSDQANRCISIPYLTRPGGVPDRAGTVVMTCAGGMFVANSGWSRAFIMIQANVDCTNISRITEIGTQTWGNDSGWTSCPYYGIGQAVTGANIFEGAGIGTSVPNPATNIYDAVSGSVWGPDKVLGISNILTPQYTVYFQEIKNILLAGKMYDIPATYIDILDQDSNPANKTFYVYVYYSNNIAQYLISPTVRPEASTQSLIATVITGPTQIDRIIPYNRFSMDGVIISAKRQGSAILASSGSVDGVGDTSTILLDTDWYV